MPIYYDIYPKANLLLYVCTKSLNAVKFFETADKAAHDPRYQH